MSARRVSLALIVVAVLFCLSSTLFAQDSKARIVRLSYIDGQVQIDRNAGQGWEKAILNMPIIQGTKLSAEQGSHVEVEFEDGSTVRLVGPAQIAFPELTLRADGKRNSLIDAQSGLVYFDVPKVHDDSFRVAIGKHNFEVHKNAQFRVDASDPDQSVAVMKGELQLLGEPKEVAVKKNETITFKFDQPEYALTHDIDKLGTDSWNKDREQDRQLVARSDQYRNTNSYYGGNYNYGTYDLARYGNWYYGAGYGWLWRPYFYDASYAYDPFAWDPFGNGSWSFYPGAGWTFVSGYPWGWAPYRYGSWMFVPGFGWSWRPGLPSYGWQTVPPVINAPPGYGIPRPPIKTGGTTVAVTGPGRTPVSGFNGVPRPGRTSVPTVVVPTRPVVMPGALNAGRPGNSHAITPMDSQMRGGRGGAPNSRANSSATQQPSTRPSTAPSAAQPTMRPTPHAEPHASPRMSPPPSMPPMRMPAPAAGSGGKPHK
jgi:hypothetical protein